MADPASGATLTYSYNPMSQVSQVSSLYMISDPVKGQILKWGITDDPAGRYKKSQFNSWDEEYEGTFQMNILYNFDTPKDADAAERQLTQRVGGPENYEDWKNTVPNKATWDQVFKDALRSLQGESEMG